MIVCYLITMRYGLNLGGPRLNLDRNMGSNSEWSQCTDFVFAVCTQCHSLEKSMVFWLGESVEMAII